MSRSSITYTANFTNPRGRVVNEEKLNDLPYITMSDLPENTTYTLRDNRGRVVFPHSLNDLPYITLSDLPEGTTMTRSNNPPRRIAINKNLCLRSRHIACMENFEKKFEDMKCSVCYINLQTHMLDCDHSFCEDCIKNWVKEEKDTCPVCRKPFKNKHLNEEVLAIIGQEIYKCHKCLFKDSYYKYCKHHCISTVEEFKEIISTIEKSTASLTKLDELYLKCKKDWSQVDRIEILALIYTFVDNLSATYNMSATNIILKYRENINNPASKEYYLRSMRTLYIHNPTPENHTLLRFWVSVNYQEFIE